MKPPADAGTRERILFLLKTRGPQTAAWLAKRLDITPTAVRQHLDRLGDEDQVEEAEPAAGEVGRPARRWRISDAGSDGFPEGYADLAVDLITATREAFGAEGIDRLIEVRTAKQRAAYRRQLPPTGAPLGERVAALARIRRDEGYMAECSRSGAKGWLLVENHCPICAAAELCQGLCGAELELFESVLGRGVKVERTEHILEGARRCAYRIEPKG